MKTTPEGGVANGPDSPEHGETPFHRLNATRANPLSSYRRHAEPVETVHRLLDELDAEDGPEAVTIDPRATAPLDLEALGVDHPHRRWQVASDFLAAWRQYDAPAVDRGLLKLAILLRVWEIWVRAGRDPWEPTQFDVDEAIAWAQHHFGGNCIGREAA